MKALILNSGRGKRMGGLTDHAPKALTKLYNGESIFARQIRILSEFGVREFIVTTGPFAAMLEEEAQPFVESGCRFEFIHNPAFETTNYIYSMHLAREAIGQNDLLILHGDLVFDRRFTRDFLEDTRSSVVAIAEAQQQNKDFKAKVVDGRIAMVSVALDSGIYDALQPFYRLNHTMVSAWLQTIERFVERGDTSVYAEDALNVILSDVALFGFDYGSYCVSEIDDPSDLERVSRDIAAADWGDQSVYRSTGNGAFELKLGLPLAGLQRSCAEEIFSILDIKRPLVIMSSHVDGDLIKYITDALPTAVVFDGYSSNPSLEEAANAVRAFERGSCDSILSIGGGSAIDVAKVVKAEITQGCGATFHGNCVLPFHVAVPTTAGTGSESTHFAVVYENGVKRSIADAKLLPDCVLLVPKLLDSLSDFQKKCTLLDALCQSIESIWSKGSMPISRSYAVESIDLILEEYEAYLAGNRLAQERMMYAANLSGKAINITKTTAAHAMSYGLTSLFGFPHGLAVALCLSGVWEYTLRETWLLDGAARERVEKNLALAARALTGKRDASPQMGIEAYQAILKTLFPSLPLVDADEQDIERLVSMVNAERLKNHPVVLTSNTVSLIYENLLLA